jgi:TRAP-type C4-dicarboxylate transport system permease small subunit
MSLLGAAAVPGEETMGLIRLMTAFDRQVERVSQFLLAVGCLLVFLMMVHVCLDVVGKHVLGIPITLTLEAVTFYYMPACVFLPLGIVQSTRGNFSVEVFTNALPPRALAAVDGVVAILGIVVILMIAWFGLGEALLRTLQHELVPNRTSVLLEIWPARWFVVVAMCLVGIHMTIQAVQDLTFALTGIPVGHHAERHQIAEMPADAGAM